MTQQTTTAVLIERHGRPDVLVERDVPLADPGPEDVHLRVHATGVNFADLFMREGLYDTVPPRPFSPGFEVAGEVMRVGHKVPTWKPGDRAVALMRYGGYARDVVLPARQLFRYPDSLTPAEAAAVPVVFLTAWVALFRSGNARSGETVLVLVAGGGVGSAAVQLAVHHGMRVIGTAGSERKRKFVTEELGAEVCFDSRGDWEPDVRALVGDRGVDVALDAMGGRHTAACRRLLAPLGRSWLRAAWAWLRTPLIHPLSLIQPNISVSGIHLLHLQKREDLMIPALQEIYRGLEAGHWRPVLDRTFGLDRAGAVEAHKYIHARKNLGKVVLVSGKVG
jgi:NADPH2:quinone reductase